MALNNKTVIPVKAGILMLLFLFAGCATSPSVKHVYEQGYRAGVNEQMEAIAAKFQGGQFPYYQWTAPIVQDVRVPAHIANGVFIPEHNELVLIKPGEWQKSPAYPIAGNEKKENQEKKDHEQPISINYSDSADLTVLP